MIYFISYGYGFSVALIGFFLLLSFNNLTLDEKILGLLYIIYGLRLGIFLLIRNLNSSYTNKMKGRIKENKDFALFVLIMIWISASLLYACQTSPLAYKIISEKKEKKYSYIGIIISIIGLIIEIEADNQKTRSTALMGGDDILEAEDALYNLLELIERGSTGIALVAKHHGRPLAVAHSTCARVGEAVDVYLLSLQHEYVVVGLFQPLFSFFASALAERLNHLDFPSFCKWDFHNCCCLLR